MKTMHIKVLMFGAMTLGVLAASARADVAPAAQNDTIVSFEVRSEATVVNTRLSLLLQASVQGKGMGGVLPELARRLNAKMNTALRLIEQTSGITAQTSGMRSQPIFDGGKQVGWRLIGQMSVSGDAKVVPALTGKLQSEGLSVESVQAAPGRQALRLARDRQTTQAIRALSERAEVVSRALGCSAWTFTQVDLSDQGAHPPVGVLRMSAVQAGPTALAPGVTRVIVNAAAKMRCVSGRRR